MRSKKSRLYRRWIHFVHGFRQLMRALAQGLMNYELQKRDNPDFMSN
jgi:hypothetical protein